MIRCLLPRRKATPAVLFEVFGRVVWRLHDGELPAGKTLFSWGAQDDDGRYVAAGVYLVKASMPAEDGIVRVVLTR